MSKYLMLNDFSGAAILKAIAARNTIHVDSRVDEIKESGVYLLFYDPNFNCFRVYNLCTTGPNWPNSSMTMRLCPFEIFIQKIKPSKTVSVFLNSSDCG